MSETTNDNQQSPMLPETTGLPVLQSGGEVVPAVPGCAAQDECSATPVVYENAQDVRPDDDQADSSGKKPRLNVFWQVNTDEAVRLWKGGASGGEIGAILGTTRGSVIGRMRRLGLLGSPERMSTPIHKWTPEEDAELVHLITIEGMGYIETAAAMNATYDSVRHRAQRLGIRAKPIWNSSRKGTMRRAPRLVIPAADPPDTSMAVHILDTTTYDRRCRFPLWGDDEQSEFLFCGHKTAHETTSYCAYHHHLCHGEGTKSERIATRLARAIVAHNSYLVGIAPELVADITAEATLPAV